MNKTLLLSAALSAAVLSGCMATSEDSVNLAEVNFSDLTCEQIESTFKDYKANVDSGDNYSSLISMASTEAATAAKEAKAAAMEIYYTAKETAQPAIKAKNCSISI